MDRMNRAGIMNEDKQTNNTAAKTEVPDTEKEALTEEELETVSGGFLRKPPKPAPDHKFNF